MPELNNHALISYSHAGNVQPNRGWVIRCVCLSISLICSIGCQDAGNQQNASEEKPLKNSNQIIASNERDQYLELDELLYEPRESDFKMEYMRDASNQSLQSWNDYYAWVVIFYHGNFMDAGWNDRCEKLLICFKDHEKKAVVRTRLNHLGRLLASEWSKDNSIRKIDTSLLRDLGRRIDRFVIENKADENATCDEILNIIADVKSQIESR